MQKTSPLDTQTFIRDPDGDLNLNAPAELVQKTLFDGDAKLPADGEFTGYVREGVELWISESQLATGIYMVDGDSVELWPRLDPHRGCE